MWRRSSVVRVVGIAALVAVALGAVVTHAASAKTARVATADMTTTGMAVATGVAAGFVPSSRTAPTAPEPDVGTVRMIHRPGEAQAGTDSGRWDSMVDFMTWVERDVASVWNWYYGQWNLTGTSDAMLLFMAPGESVTTGCGDATNNMTMEYCQLDDTIYFSQELATHLWDGTYVGPDGQRFTAAGGDFAVAMLLAHEYGHNVQSELRVLGNYSTPATEQMADCLSGAFARVAYYQNVLDAGDYREGLTAAFMVGDSYTERSDHHGDSPQRMAAWQLGYDSASPASCWSLLR